MLALVFNNAVVDIVAASFPVNPTMTWVDVTHVSPLPASGWAYDGRVFTAPAAPVPPVQAAPDPYAAFIAGGLSIVSTSTPAINGTYAIDPASCADVSAEVNFLTAFAEFTNGGAVNQPWMLANGTQVTIPTTAAFLSIAKVIGQKVATAKLASALKTAMPSATVTVA